MLQKQLSFKLWFKTYNWTTQTFAKEIEKITGKRVSTASVYNWLNGVHIPRREGHVKAIEQISGMRLSEFNFNKK